MKLSESDLQTQFDSDGEIYKLLKVSAALGFDNKFGAVETTYEDGNNLIVSILADEQENIIFLTKFESTLDTKSILIHYIDDEHYALFDASGGIKRDGKDFTLLEESDIESMSLEGKQNFNGDIAIPNIIYFGFCDEKGGGFWACIWENKRSLGFSILGAIVLVGLIK